MMIDFSLILHSLPALFQGVLVTLAISFMAILMGLTFGVTLGFGLTSKKRWLVWLIKTYVQLFRGTPTLIQILIVFYVFPQFGIELEPFWAVILAMTCNSAAYTSQIFYSGLLAVSKQQEEVAKVLGFTKSQIKFFIVLPQALRVCLPGFGNEWITVLKDSSLASVIGVVELTKSGTIIRSQTYDALSILLTTAAIYFCLTFVIVYGVKKIRIRFGSYVTG